MQGSQLTLRVIINQVSSSTESNSSTFITTTPKFFFSIGGDSLRFRIEVNKQNCCEKKASLTESRLE